MIPNDKNVKVFKKIKPHKKVGNNKDFSRNIMLLENYNILQCDQYINSNIMPCIIYVALNF